jgi:hypothetical protein
MAGRKRDNSHPDKTAQGPAAALRALARLLGRLAARHPLPPAEPDAGQTRAEPNERDDEKQER